MEAFTGNVNANKGNRRAAFCPAVFRGEIVESRAADLFEKGNNT